MMKSTQLILSGALETPPTARELLERAVKFFGAPDPHCTEKNCEMCDLGTEIRNYLSTK